MIVLSKGTCSKPEYTSDTEKESMVQNMFKYNLINTKLKKGSSKRILWNWRPLLRSSNLEL